MHILNFETFLIAITILTLTPGLDTALVIRNSSRSGYIDGCVTSLGICSGLFVHAMFSALGISAILLQSADLFQVVKWIGAAYLMWLGFTSLRSIHKGAHKIVVNEDNKKSFSARRSLREGFLSNVLNPKTAIFYLAFLPQFIDLNYSPVLQSFTMASVHFLIAMMWQCSLAFAINSAKNLFKSSALTNWMEGITGMVLILLGAKLLLSDNKL
ncbi:LysE family translocator [Psychromonas antarctica]|jgi:RhtB (resistance to homoserine/threonine) family protein|uniref:LysE family translocator n=1 Tax=Psychromonas antarctica TaxID=67573 RepID=UPI001EE8A503|nr:LysE family translocator [Psychromonas antarctica]MCG6200646.1 LysE family translocator [Psychromonas antarctica]